MCISIVGAGLLVLAAGSGRVAAGGLRERVREETDYVDIDHAERDDPVEVRGVVMTYGTPPHTYTGILVAPGGATGGGPERATVYRLEIDREAYPPPKIEGRTVIVRGRLVSRAVGPGFPAVIAGTEIIPSD